MTSSSIRAKPLSPSEAARVFQEINAANLDEQIDRVNATLSTTEPGGAACVVIPPGMRNMVANAYREIGWIVEVAEERDGSYLHFKRPVVPIAVEDPSELFRGPCHGCTRWPSEHPNNSGCQKWHGKYE